MSISGALSNAMSGLRAAGRGAEVVSANISNALTPGYARRVLELSSARIGDHGGVRIDGISRIVDTALAADRRNAEADAVRADVKTDFYARLESMLGSPDDAGSLSTGMASFESSLITAASRPDAPERLATVVAEAKGVVKNINALSQGIQQLRTDADRTIGTQVDTLNVALQQVVDLNSQITASQAQGGDAASLLDLRQQVVDQIGVLVPVRELPRQNGQIALYTTGGAVLVDGAAATIGFTPSNVVTPYMSAANNTVSGLSINGQSVRIDAEKGALRGGSIGAQFEIRDDLGVAMQTEVDALARDLVERFQDPAVDPTLALGDAGLFTDADAHFDPLDEIGLADRLKLNTAVDPDQGGDTWRIRDGIGAAVEGTVGDARQINRLSDALSVLRAPLSGSFAGGNRSAVNLVAAYASDVSANQMQIEQQLSFANARLTELTERQLAGGVDSDAEFQHLLTIEQNYAANARMIQTIEEMMDQILRL